MSTTELHSRAKAAGLGAIADKVFAEERLTREEGVQLYATPELHVLGELANHVRERWHGDLAFFNVNQHINYTNLCNKFCKFCSFDRLPGQEGAYQMTPDQVAEKIRAYVELGCRGFIPWCSDYPGTETLELLADEVMPEFR